MDTSSIVGAELIQVADVVARDKGIERELVLAAMEQAIQKAGHSHYGQDRDIRANIDRETGDITLVRVITVVDVVEDEATQISVKDAAARGESSDIGYEIREPLPPLQSGRIAASAAKQVIMQQVREAERARQYEEYKDRIGEVVTGIVKRAERFMIGVDLGRAEGIIRREEMIPREVVKLGDNIRCYIKDVREEARGAQIFLSRADNRFMAELFAMNVPEIYDGIIEIKNVVREPGSRAKIAVHSNDPSIHAVGSCVGMRGNRVQAVVNELHNEKIEIVPWSEDISTFAINALAPAEVSKVVVYQDEDRLEVLVPDTQLSLAIGRRGQNVRLASELIGWHIDILSQSEDSERHQKRVESFMEQLDIDDVIAGLLVTEGFTSIKDIAEADVAEIMSMQGFDESIANELRNRAIDIVEAETKRIKRALRKFKVAKDLKTFKPITLPMLLALAENEVLTLDDLAELDMDEVLEILGAHGIKTETQAGDLIMKARAHWFPDEDSGEAEADGKAETDSTAEADDAAKPAKPKKAAKTKTPAKTKAAAKPKAASKTKTAAKAKPASKTASKTKAVAKAKPAKKATSKTASKAKTAAKAKTATKAKSASKPKKGDK